VINLKKRIISAIIMLIICIPLIIIGGIPFKIGMGILAILAYREVLNLKGIKNYPKSIVVIGLVVMLLLVYSNRDVLYEINGLNYKYLMAAFLLFFVPVIFYYGKDKYTSSDAFELSAFTIFLGLIFNLVTNILIYEKAYFFLIILVTVLTDTFAYFTGVAIGRHKVTKISPKKSIEGYIGGCLMGTAISTI
jgi:phosphatidate cytidylyltransferase